MRGAIAIHCRGALSICTDDLPSRAARVAADYPDVWSHYQALGNACAKDGPLNEETVHLVKLAIAVGAGSEGAVHSHLRRGLGAGVAPEALRQVAVLATTTIGFPKAVAALRWIEDILENTRESVIPALARYDGGLRSQGPRVPGRRGSSQIRRPHPR